ncbi:glycogen synthase GlgA [uncultured Enterococcus sp.]|uniref:glycogen synthase GlgA n=1 Tax=uncultured Enterococcus sp. TaxID=167972 RepID=UPI0025D5BEDB|nr:glycogen synthase GlgA [uncultured Enterococcus sp.]
MKILFAAAECAPFFKSGGLGDVAGALPKKLKEKGHDIRVILPYMSLIPKEYQEATTDVLDFVIDVGWRKQYCGIKTLTLNDVQYYFIDNQYYFNRPAIYGYDDDGERFAFFQQALIEAMEKLDFIPDIVHTNDYHTAFVPFLLKEKYRWINAFQQIQTVLTIHNIEFQGYFEPYTLGDWFQTGAEHFEDGMIAQNGMVNWLKSGIVYADRVNTVSPNYAKEIQTGEFGCGLDAILRQESQKLVGILNGIDYSIYDPMHDRHIFEPFDQTTLNKKTENKLQLQKLLGLPIEKDVPMIGMVSRLTHQKGFHLVMEKMEELLTQQAVQIVVLGTGETGFEDGFRYFESRFPEKVRACITFDVDLAQKIYAGADMFLMPSAFEPCGLSQMMSMRYGTLPIVHQIGGLSDTVWPFNPVTHEGTGFGFVDFQAYALKQAVDLALHIYKEVPDVWREVVIRAMDVDFSWETASEHYIHLYHEMVGM